MSPGTPQPGPGTPALDARGLPVGYPFKPDWEVTPRQAHDALTRGGDGPEGTPLLLDVRRPDEVATAKIAGSVHIPMEQVAGRLTELEDPEGGRARPIIVHCHHGVRSMKVAALLRQNGFERAVSMAGGIDAWSLAVDPGVKRY